MFLIPRKIPTLHSELSYLHMRLTFTTWKLFLLAKSRRLQQQKYEELTMKKVTLQSHLSALSNNAYHILVARFDHVKALVD